MLSVLLLALATAPSLKDELTAARVTKVYWGSDTAEFGWEFLLPGLELRDSRSEQGRIDPVRWKVTKGISCIVVRRLSDGDLAFIDSDGRVFSSRRMCRSR